MNMEMILRSSKDELRAPSERYCHAIDLLLECIIIPLIRQLFSEYQGLYFNSN